MIKHHFLLFYVKQNKKPHGKLYCIMRCDNFSVILAERPKADIIPGQTLKDKVSPAPTPSQLKDGEVLVENLYLSLDPAMRGWMRGKPGIYIVLKENNIAVMSVDFIALLSYASRPMHSSLLS